jgi:hypothetical protein
VMWHRFKGVEVLIMQVSCFSGLRHPSPSF